MSQIDFAGYTPANGAMYPDTILGSRDHGRHARRASSSLEAFYLDMLAGIDDVVVVVQSEFGRRVLENASAGLDHGHGSATELASIFPQHTFTTHGIARP